MADGKQDLQLQVAARVTFVVTYQGQPSSIEEDLTLSVTFNRGDHSSWQLAPLSLSPNIAGHQVTVALGADNSGTFNPATGQLTLAATLTFDAPWPAGSGSVSFNLSSANPGGQPLTKNSPYTATLAGSSVIQEGGMIHPLNNDPATMTMALTLPTYP